MKAFRSTVVLVLVLGACSRETVEPSAIPAPTRTAPPAQAAQPVAEPSSASGAPAGEPVHGVWAGQVRIDAHAGIAWLNYVGEESGDFVPMRFRTDSEAGTTILAQCGDDDLCEIEGSVQFLDELPPENASAIGEIVRVDRVKKLPPA